MAKTVYKTPGYVPHPTPPEDKICANCGKPYSGNPRSKFCDDACQRASAIRKYKVKRLGGRVESVTMLDVAKATGGKCHVCGLACELAMPANEAASTTMDHLIPTSLGGPHVIGNTKLAHMICNTEKDVSVKPQALIFSDEYSLTG
jgi:5-methylcytosine-specific restriction endonuclease McrA